MRKCCIEPTNQYGKGYNDYDDLQLAPIGRASKFGLPDIRHAKLCVEKDAFIPKSVRFDTDNGVSIVPAGSGFGNAFLQEQIERLCGKVIYWDSPVES
jgi:hypothetical protein